MGFSSRIDFVSNPYIFTYDNRFYKVTDEGLYTWACHRREKRL
ncbi:hypothetical protein [Saccharolobus solfataricus]|nr:hypothetical protein [Saccharolobus solfataricus]